MAGSIEYSVVFKEYAQSALNKIKGLLSGLKTHASGVTSEIGSRFAQMFTLGAIMAFTRSVSEYVSNIKHAADATGLAADNFQALSMVARENGVSTEKLTGFLMRLRMVQERIGEDEHLQKVFEKIGISVADVQNSKPDDLLKRIADGIQSTGNASVAFDIFGRGGSRMLSTLRELTGGWDALKSKTRGGIITEDDMASIEKFSARMETAFTKIKAWSAKAALACTQGWSSFWAAMGAMSAGATWKEAWDVAAAQEMPPDKGTENAPKETPGPDLVAAKRDDEIRKANAQRRGIERQSKFDLADEDAKLGMLQSEEAAWSQIAAHHDDAVKRAQAEVELAKVRAAILKQDFEMRSRAWDAEERAMKSAEDYDYSKMDQTAKITHTREEIERLGAVLQELAQKRQMRDLSAGERTTFANTNEAMIAKQKQLDDLLGKGDHSPLSIVSDDMAKIGLYMGGHGSSGIDYARRTADATEKSHEALQKLLGKGAQAHVPVWGR